MSHSDPTTAVMMQVPEVGAFVRVLLPVALVGGDTVTFGLWLGISPDDLQRAFATWWEPGYVDLVLDGRIANDVQPWGLLARPALAVVRDPDETPYLTSSSDPAVHDVLTKDWAHTDVIDAFPEAMR